MPAVLLPNGEQVFLDNSGNPLALGTVDFYIPTTTTRKNTWQDPNKATLNDNPVKLDAAGRAIIYGEGQYRQVVKDSLGNVIWDQLTADPFFGRSAIPFGETSGVVGFPNIQEVVLDPPLESLANGQIICVQPGLFMENDGALTLDVDDLGAVAVTYSDGNTLSGGEFQIGVPTLLAYTSSGPAWRILAPNQRIGTWTPVFTLGSGSISAYNLQKGFYRVIGNVLEFNLVIKYTGAAAPNGALSINMPLLSVSLTDQNWSYAVLPADATTSFALSGADITFSAHLPSNSSTLTIVSFAEGNGAIASAGGSLATAGAVGIRICGSYFIGT